jgi:hypothetical protein
MPTPHYRSRPPPPGENEQDAGSDSAPTRAQSDKATDRLRASIAQPGERLSWPVCALLIGGTAVHLASFGFTRWPMLRDRSCDLLPVADPLTPDPRRDLEQFGLANSLST